MIHNDFSCITTLKQDKMFEKWPIRSRNPFYRSNSTPFFASLIYSQHFPYLHTQMCFFTVQLATTAYIFMQLFTVITHITVLYNTLDAIFLKNRKETARRRFFLLFKFITTPFQQLCLTKSKSKKQFLKISFWSRRQRGRRKNGLS